jgi:2-polyprenyl-3-methyl-5-hydroxy-6-metoxy-1,4-benzoquinol methylase
MRFTQNRIDDIIELGILDNKAVLEFGCVGMGIDDEYGGINWIHGRVKKVAKKLIGLDRNKKGVEKLRKLGFDARVQNVEEKFDLGEKFDVVLVEEVFEHLNNVGLALDNIRRHLKKGGLLIITTPHAQSASFFLQRLFRDEISGVSITDHTLWYDRNTLNTILKRYNFKMEKVWYVQPKPIKYTPSGLVIRAFLTLLPSRVGRNLCCIAKKLD